MKLLWGTLVLLGLAGGLGALPLVDGAVGAGEYAQKTTVMGGAVTVSWAGDGSGGLFLAVSAPTSGWVGLGLGSRVMNGAWIYMGYVKDGKAVFSEQKGAGHTHRPVAEPAADQSAVALAGGRTTVEFHLPAAKLPVKGTSFPFITAYSGPPT